MSLEVFDQAEQWLERGQRVAMATVVRTGGSSPRPLGSKMAISETSGFAGSVSGGCVEGAVVAEAESVIETGVPKLLRYGISDELAWSVGLSCGGEIEVFLELILATNEEVLDDSPHRFRRINNWFQVLHQCLKDEQDARSITVIESPESSLLGTRVVTIQSSDDHPAYATPLVHGSAAQHFLAPKDELVQRLDSLAPGPHIWEHSLGKLVLFAERLVAPPKMVIVGAVHIAEHLVHFASRLGFHTVVVDPREAFLSEERFSHASQRLVGWPEEIFQEVPLRSSTYVACLSHDPKIDDPALIHGLDVGVRYLGALGSTRTHAKRLARLQEIGLSPDQLAQIDAPIGLDLGGRRPEEIALAIAARVVQVRADAMS